MSTRGAGHGRHRSPTLRPRLRVGQTRPRRVFHPWRLTYVAGAPGVPIRRLLDEAMPPAYIVIVYDFFESDGVPYIAMEYLPRGSLRPFVGRLTSVQVFGVLEGTLAALAHAEQHRVVHGDLKPENVLITRGGEVKITDFGVAQASTRATSSRLAASRVGSAQP